MAAAGGESDETVQGCADSARSTRSTEEVRLRSGLPQHTAVRGNQVMALSGFTQFSFLTSLSVKRCREDARSPKHREVDFTEAGLSAQLPVRVVAHPRVVVGLPATHTYKLNFYIAS